MPAPACSIDLRDRKVPHHRRQSARACLFSEHVAQLQLPSADEALLHLGEARDQYGSQSDWYRRTVCDLCLTDCANARSDGIETGNAFFPCLTASHPPHLVMVTAYGREEVMKQAEESGFDNVLIKPVTSSVLFDTAVMALDLDIEGNIVLFGQNSPLMFKA